MGAAGAFGATHFGILGAYWKSLSDRELHHYAAILCCVLWYCGEFECGGGVLCGGSDACLLGCVWVVFVV